MLSRKIIEYDKPFYSHSIDKNLWFYDNDPNKSWQYCRDGWHSNYPVLREFLINRSLKKCRKLSRFIDLIENRFKLKYRTTFYPTQDSDVCWVILSSFWCLKDSHTYQLRYSFFTAMLRAADEFYKPSKKKRIEQILTKSHYFRFNEKHVKRFLCGKNRLNPKGKNNWRDTVELIGEEYGWRDLCSEFTPSALLR